MKLKLATAEGDLDAVRVCIAAAVSNQELALEKRLQGLQLSDGELSLSSPSAISSFVGRSFGIAQAYLQDATSQA